MKLEELQYLSLLLTSPFVRAYAYTSYSTGHNRHNENIFVISVISLF